MVRNLVVKTGVGAMKARKGGELKNLTGWETRIYSVSEQEVGW